MADMNFGVPIHAGSEPTPQERDTYESVQESLKNCPTILSELGEYEGAGTEIRLVSLMKHFEFLLLCLHAGVCWRLLRRRKRPQP